MRGFIKNQSGVSAIEFALIAPLLTLMLLGIMSSWSYFRQNSNMRDSVEAVGKYYIQGGATDTTAQAIANATWINKPASGVITVSRACVCVGVSGACTAGVLCSDPGKSVPEIHLTILATSSWTDPFSSFIFPNGLSLKETEVVRVR
jgi:Flp pilus assembly protein TadG